MFKELEIMRRTYIVPATENIVLANDIMQSLSIITGSGAPTVDTGDAID